MSPPALVPLPFALVYDDGEPMDSGWHVLQFCPGLPNVHEALVNASDEDLSWSRAGVFVTNTFRRATKAGRLTFEPGRRIAGTKTEPAGPRAAPAGLESTPAGLDCEQAGLDFEQAGPGKLKIRPGKLKIPPGKSKAGPGLLTFGVESCSTGRFAS